MDCLVLPVSSILRRRGYRQLAPCSPSPVRVVVGKEKREFLVDPFVLEENPFRVLMESRHGDGDIDHNNDKGKGKRNKERAVYVDVDAILFEHMLWLMHNDCASLFQLNLHEIIDFYNHDF